VKKIIILLFLLTTSCAAPSFDKRVDYIYELNDNKFGEFVYKNSFKIYSLQKINNNEKVVVYIEGDGLSWIDRFTPSSDPTPKNPLAFKLAKLDQNQNVIYLARPCQYIQSNRCQREIWTKLQYSNEIMANYTNILKELKNKHSEVHLVGYSGGSVIAMYLASIKELNIKSVRTVAGNIKPNEFTQLLNISPYRTSLNLNDIENNIKLVSQSHFYGDKDKVIPEELYTNYQERNLNNSCIKFTKVNATHNKRWESFWKNNSNTKVNC
tara:strand:+ start:71 stop:871 length:801 start_codon:yes stop_codon:yes gene_type:complete